MNNPLTLQSLKTQLAQGEDSYHQFKQDQTNVNAIAAELVAFSNGNGGRLFIGVTDEGEVAGLEAQDIRRLNQLVSNAASQSVRPPINPLTQNIALPEGHVLVVNVEAGISKPYMDNQRLVWVKSGSDKRKVTAREELQRMFQQASLVHADEIPVPNATLEHLDLAYFSEFFEQHYHEPLKPDATPQTLAKLLENMNLQRDGLLNLTGALLFSKRPQFLCPVFVIKAVSFIANEITDLNYIDSQDIHGKFADVYSQSMAFVLRNIRHEQQGQSVNSLGKPEIPSIVIQELLANALIHRDYFVSAPIRLLVFANRIEIISPGHLPNNLTIDNIKLGNSNVRNPVLASFSTRVLPYRGLGSGILRALQAWPNIEFIDDRQGNQFKVVVTRVQDESKPLPVQTSNRPDKSPRRKVFVSYSHKDKDMLERVQVHLKVLENEGLTVNLWDDSQIKAGDNWLDEIEVGLSSAKVAILLVSTDFLASEFITNSELPALLESAQNNGATILPLILKPCRFAKNKQLSVFQSVNDPQKPLSKLSEDKREEVLLALAERVEELMNKE